MQQNRMCRFLAGAALLLSAVSPGAAVEGTKKGIQQTAVIEPKPEMVARLIVKPRDRSGAKLAQALQARDASGLAVAAGAPLSVVRAMSGGAHVLRLNQAVPLEEARAIATRLQRDGSVEYAEPDRIVYRSEYTPTDPLYNGQNVKQWHYFAPSGSNKGGANLPAAWDNGRGGVVGGGTIVVAVLDTGHVRHEDLAHPLVNAGYDFVSYSTNGDGNGWDSDPTDPGDGVIADECGYDHAARSSSWHGLHVTGTIAALMNNKRMDDSGIGGTGIAPDAQILPVRVLGKCGGYVSDVADAMRWAAGIPVANVPNNPTPAHVLNLSLGSSGSCSATFQQAVADVLGRERTVIAAAGNDGAIGLLQPANCSGVLAVTAHAIDGDNARYANVDSRITISAPGGGCGTLATSCTSHISENGLGVISLHKADSATPSTSYAMKSGTSMATPHVTGVVALMLAQNTALTPAELKSHLQSAALPHAEDTFCKQNRYLGLCGEGTLDAHLAVQKVKNGAPTLLLNNVYQVVAPGQQVMLSGEGAVDSLYEWSQSSGSAVDLSTTTAIAGKATASFTAPASGVYTFQLDVTRNLQSGKATATVRVNSAPVLQGIPIQTVVAGNRLSFSVSATDNDGDPFTFRSVSLPPGATLSSGGTFRWSSATPVGTHMLTYYAVDDAGAQSATGSVEIVVSGGTGGGGGGGGGSLGWSSLLLLGVLSIGWRLHGLSFSQRCRLNRKARE